MRQRESAPSSDEHWNSGLNDAILLQQVMDTDTPPVSEFEVAQFRRKQIGVAHRLFVF